MTSHFSSQRTERLPSITYPKGMELDPIPFEMKGRLLPGEVRSGEEMSRLVKIVSEARLLEDSAQFALLSLALPSPDQLDRIMIRPQMGCWELPVYEDLKARARYGSMSIASLGSNTLAHRTIWAVMHGSIQPGLFLDHLCQNKACCWNRHLEPVTPKTNTMRGREARTTGQMSFEQF